MLNFIRRVLGRPEQHHVPKIRFLGEQSGAPESELKLALQPLFKDRSQVRRAYLARVAYVGEEVWRVALCIYGPGDPDLVALVESVFRQQFAKGVPLDIVFLSEEQDLQAQQACQPFYSCAA